MNDTKTTIKELKTAVRAFIDERDWSQFHSPKNMSMALAIEAAELMEKFQWVDTDGSWKMLEKKRGEIEDELADIIIDALEFAIQCDIDVSRAVEDKIEEIKKKYPVEKVKGKSLKYNEYN